MVGDRIKRLRQHKGYSITELAEMAGVSKSYLSYIERNLQNNPSLQFLVKIAAPLETSVEYIIGQSIDAKKAEPGVDILDEEWKSIIQKAINDGMSKDDFREYRDFLRFRHWKKSRPEFDDWNNGG